MELKEKLAIVTGVSKGLGRSFAEALLDSGMYVAGWSRNAPDLKHQNFKFFKVDVRLFNDVEEAYKRTMESFNQEPEVLINNAGLGYGGLLEETKVEEWKQMFEVNVNGLFYCSKVVIPAMKRKGEGHIINIASVAGKEGFPMLGGYCATKFAVRGLSQSMYKELRDYGVKVTCISPGSVKTDFFDNIGHLSVNDNMMQAEDLSKTLLHILQTSPNYHPVEIELRPLMPKGKKVVG